MNLTTNELINLKYMMKVISIATWLMLLILAGCGDASPSAEEPSAQERTITLNLDITTRAEAGEEESPDNFHLWIFNGSKLLKYIGTSPTWDEVYKGGIDLKATVETEIDATGITAIQFYLLLNVPEGTITNANYMTPDSLKALTFTLPDPPYSHDNKVPMSCDTTLNIFPSQIHYDVEMNAVRCVGKLEVYCTKNLESTKLSLKEITLGYEPDKGYLWETPSDITYNNKERTLFKPQNGQEITTVLTGDLPNNDKLEEVIDKFTPITFSSSPYLLENMNGGDALQVEGVDETITEKEKRYYLTLNYTLDESTVTKKIYLTKIERNTLNKVFIRIKEKVFDIEVSYSVKPWDLVVLTPEF